MMGEDAASLPLTIHYPETEDSGIDHPDSYPHDRATYLVQDASGEVVMMDQSYYNTAPNAATAALIVELVNAASMEKIRLIQRYSKGERDRAERLLAEVREKNTEIEELKARIRELNEEVQQAVWEGMGDDN